MWLDEWLEFVRQERMGSLDLGDWAALARSEADFYGVG
jgi:hypothetical protein